MDAEQAWQAALDQLAGEMSRSGFNQYVRDTHVVSYADGVFQIGVPTVEAQEWLEDRVKSTVQRRLVGMMNRFVEVHFVVEPRAEKEVELAEKDSEVENSQEAEYPPENAWEVEEKPDGEENRKENNQTGVYPRRGWTPLPDGLVKQYGLTVAAVAGKIWRYSQMREKVCRASLSRLASELNLDRSTIRRAIQVLVLNGFVVDRTPTLRHRPHGYGPTEKIWIHGSTKAVSSGTRSPTETRPSTRPPSVTPGHTDISPVWSSATLPPTDFSQNTAENLPDSKDMFLDPLSVTLCHTDVLQSPISVVQSYTDASKTSLSATLSSTLVTHSPFSVTPAPVQCDSESIQCDSESHELNNKRQRKKREESILDTEINPAETKEGNESKHFLLKNNLEKKSTIFQISTTPPLFEAPQLSIKKSQDPKVENNTSLCGWCSVPLGRLELPFLAPEANALSTELQGRTGRFYHGKLKPAHGGPGPPSPCGSAG